jgi:cyclopropane-fatty-acyl-phospholipid synthase
MALLATFTRMNDAAYERIMTQVFKRAPYGTLCITGPGGWQQHFEGAKPGPKADLHVHDWKMLKQALLRGDIGFGETYIEGHWSTSDLSELMTYMVYNMEAAGKVMHANWLMRRVFQLVNWARRNTRKNSRENIRAHYDVGNAFYRLWLDETMTYSSALFAGDEHRDLAAAQRAKYQRILDKMEPAGEILEIGCGWGGFAEEATKRQHHVTGLTLSHEQHDFARERLIQKGLDNHAHIKLEDYRDTRGTFDYIVSIEMFEAVGEQYWPAYFRTVRDRLKQGGKAVIQTITIDDQYFEDYKLRSDFIRHYTFPGGLLPSMKRLKEEIEAAGLKLKETFSFGQDYAKTCQIWKETIDHKIEEIKALGYSEEFLRSWRFYLCCCVGAFAARRTDVVQLELVHA